MELDLGKINNIQYSKEIIYDETTGHLFATID